MAPDRRGGDGGVGTCDTNHVLGPPRQTPAHLSAGHRSPQRADDETGLTSGHMDAYGAALPGGAKAILPSPHGRWCPPTGSGRVRPTKDADVLCERL